MPDAINLIKILIGAYGIRTTIGGETSDYRRVDGRFLVCACYKTISSPDSLSSNKIAVSERAPWQKAVGDIVIANK
jgi:hypothetical protein